MNVKATRWYILFALWIGLPVSCFLFAVVLKVAETPISLRAWLEGGCIAVLVMGVVVGWISVGNFLLRKGDRER